MKIIHNRVIVEKLFFEFIQYYLANKPFQKLVQEEFADNTFNHLIKNLNVSDPKMTKVNVIMNNKRVQSYFFNNTGYPTGMSLPSYPSSRNILYGSLSELVHNPDLQTIIVSSDLSEEWKSAYRSLGEHFRCDYSEFDEMMAAAGEKDAVV